VSAVPHHIIRREVIDLVVIGTEAEGFELQRKLAELCRHWLTPALAETLTRAFAGDEHLSFDRLEVDAGSFTIETFAHDFVGAAAAAVEKQIHEHLLRGDAVPARTRRDGAATAHDLSPEIWPPADEMDGGDIRWLTGAQSARRAFLYFLATGALPWWLRLPAGRTLEDAVTAPFGETGRSGEDVAAALADLIASPAARLRLVRQFSPTFLELLLHRLSPSAAEIVRTVLAEMARQSVTPDTRQRLSERLWDAAFVLPALQLPVTLRRLVQEWVRSAAADARGPEWRAVAQVVQAWPDTADIAVTPAHHDRAARPEDQSRIPRNGSSAVGQPDQPAAHLVQSVRRLERSAARLDLNEGVFVDCAGVVLLHPFLPALFERLAIAADGELRQPERALALLGFLATGATRAPEYTLVLPKLLCGLSFEAPVGSPIELADDETAEANHLLAAVIGHWTVLGDTSPDALRGTFLTRPGKLTRRDDDHLLQVEPQSFDVLLDRLPWSIGAFRLPWMTTLLWVEWRM
jgi:hypothetical protein